MLFGAPISISLRGGSRFQAMLIDISTQGCRVEILHMLHADDAITAVLPTGLKVAATVRWHQDGFAGLVFDRPLHQGVLDHLTGPDTMRTDQAGSLRDVAERCTAMSSRCYATATASELTQLARACAIQAKITELTAAFGWETRSGR
jgi:hypothetical protein